MSKLIKILWLSLLFSNCIEPYDFKISNIGPAVVVEGYISDASFEDTKAYPADGRYFYLKLSYASDVTNAKGDVIEGASVSLLSQSGETRQYYENEPGLYLLKDECFKAQDKENYKVNITLPDGGIIESDWSSLPDDGIDEMGNVTFEELTEDVYKMKAGERQVVNVDGINVNIYIPDNKNKPNPIYYQWVFDPTWIFNAPIPPAVNKTCWVSSDHYLSDYILHTDIVGGYQKNLLFLETRGNDRFLWRFSLLVKQFQLNKKYYEYLEEMQTQAKKSFADRPPFNLNTNMHFISDKDDLSVVGWFSVVREKARRWYFSQRDLSYGLEDKYKTLCEDPKSVGGPLCFDCLYYQLGVPSINKPAWWED